MRMFKDFDFSLLNDPEFKEDSVREEIVSRLLRKLSYSASGPNKIIRGRRLQHPFVYIGTSTNAATIIPDYVLIVNDEPQWILDAKAPSETIISGKNPEQAYSYAIHPEIRVNRYALCNGHNLVVFDTNKAKPQLDVSLKTIDRHWDNVRRLLSPLAFIKPVLIDFVADFGLYMLKMGATPQTTIVIRSAHVPFVAKVTEGHYTMNALTQHNGERLVASFDLDDMRLEQLMKALPGDEMAHLKQALKYSPFQARFRDIPEIHIEAKLGPNVFSNENEDYCPLIVERFFTT